MIVLINYEATINIVKNLPSVGEPASIKLRNTSTISVQAVDGIAPLFEFLCGIEVDGRTVNSADCSDQGSAGMNRIPFYAAYEMFSNLSCTGRIKTNTCRLFAFVVNIHLIGNSSNSRMRTLAEEEILTTFAMTTSAVSSEETLLSSRQRIIIREPKAEEVGAPIEVSIHPSSYSKTIHRNHVTLTRYNISIQLAGRSDVRVSWIFPPRLLQFMSTPRTQAIASHLVPPRLAIRDQVLVIKTHLLPHGISTGTIKIRFTVLDEVVDTHGFDVNVTVLQGDTRLRQSSFEIALSSTAGSTSRGILLANEGDQKVSWTSLTFGVLGTDPQEEDIPWLSFPHQGNIFSKDEQSSPMELVPQLVGGLGIFEAWILIETDSWTGDTQNLAEEFPELSVPSFNAEGVHFWIHVRFIVSSIFVCQQFAPVTTILPNEMHVLPLRVINTESSPITVALRNFSITPTANESTSSLAEGLKAENSLDVEETVVNRGLRLNQWWTIAPSRLALRPGTSGGFRIKVGYTDSELQPQDLEFEFVLEVFFGRVVKTPNGVVSTDFVIAFAPGAASPQTSYVIGNQTQGSIGNQLHFVVKLLDVFGNGPATALFDPQALPSFRHKQIPLLTISVRKLHSLDANDIIRLDILTSRGAVTEFRFGLNLQADGEVELDVKLGNASVIDFPMTILSETIQCHLSFEMPDSTGTVCLCKSGHYRTASGQCSICPPGTFMPSPSNMKACSLCPKGFFAERGESTCHKCVGRGIECPYGVISMKDGYWCEVCQKLQFPRVVVIEQIRRGNNELFHECIPPESCVVNATSFMSTCTSGYAPEGPVCDTCESGFVKAGSGECLPCESGPQDLILTVVGALAFVLAIVVITVLSYRDVMSDILAAPSSSGSGLTNLPSKTDGHTGHKTPFHRGSALVSQDGVVKATVVNPLHKHAKELKPLAKIQDKVLKRNLVSVRHIVLLLVDYLQIAFIVHTMEISPFVSKNEWVNTLSTMVTFTPTQAGAVQCTMDSSPFQTSVTIMLSPIVVLLCLMVVQTLTTLYQTKCKRPFPWATLMSSLARSTKLVMNLIHMSVTYATLKVFDVYPNELDSKERSSMDLTMETSSSRYKLLQSIAIMSLIIIVIGYPILTTIYYLKLYSKAETPEALEQFGRTAGGFNVNSFGFLWESVVIIRKVTLLLVVYFVSGAVAQLILASTALIISLFLLSFMLPYKTRFVNYLQYIMILTCLVTLAIGFLIRVTLDEQGGQTKIDTLSNVVFVVQLALFLIALIVLVSLASEALKRLRIVLSNYLPPCAKCCGCGKRQKKGPKDDEWSITQSPLHDERGAVLPSWTYQDNRLSLRHDDSIAFANLVLQKENHEMYRGATKVIGSIRVNRSRKRNIATDHHR